MRGVSNAESELLKYDMDHIQAYYDNLRAETDAWLAQAEAD